MKVKILIVLILINFNSFAQGEVLLVRTLVGHTDIIRSVTFSPDGKLLASCSSQIVKLWRVNDGRLISSIGFNSEPQEYSIDFNSDGSILAVGSWDGTIKTWDTENGNLINSSDEINHPIFDVKFSPDGAMIAGLIDKSFLTSETDSNNTIGLWSVSDFRLIRQIGSENDNFSNFIFSPDGKLLATGDFNDLIKVWNVLDNSLVNTFLTQKTDLFGMGSKPIAFTIDGVELYYIYGDFINELNLKDGVNTRSIKRSDISNTGGIFSLSPDLSYVVTCERKDDKLRFWQLSDGALLCELNTKSGWVREIAFSPDGNLLATGCQDGNIYIWNISEINIDIQRDIPATKQKNKDAIAVVIGNKEYNKKEIPSVEFAINDASLVKEYLIKSLGYSPDNILYYENATQSDLFSLFGLKNNYKGKLYNYVKEGKSDVFIYYSGHGAPDIESRQGYFVPVDCDPSLVALNGYSLNTFYENLSKIKYKSLTVVIDACFSGLSEKGSLLKNISPIYVSVDNPVISNENTIVFTSTGGDQVSSWYPEKKHSLFTYYFLKGLKGEANLDNNDVLNVGELKNYLIDNVPYMSRRLNNREQTPQIIGEDKTTIVKY